MLPSAVISRAARVSQAGPIGRSGAPGWRSASITVSSKRWEPPSTSCISPAKPSSPPATTASAATAAPWPMAKAPIRCSSPGEGDEGRGPSMRRQPAGTSPVAHPQQAGAAAIATDHPGTRGRALLIVNRKARSGEEQAEAAAQALAEAGIEAVPFDPPEGQGCAEAVVAGA